LSALRYRMTLSASSHPRVEWLGPASEAGAWTTDAVMP
jgi:hypothetical protein